MTTRRRWRDQDDGLSMPELIVVIMVTSIALAMISTFAVTIMRSLAVDKDAGQGNKSAANAINEIGRVVRAGATNSNGASVDPAVWTGSTSSKLTITSYSNVDSTSPQPTKVVFELDAAKNLVETRTTSVAAAGGYWSFSGTGVTTSTRTFSGPFLSSSSAPLFDYRGVDGASVTTPLTDTTAPSVTSVAITVTVVHAGRAGDDPVQLTTTAVMPNLALN